MYTVQIESLCQARDEIRLMYWCVFDALEEIDATRQGLAYNTGMEIPIEELSALRATLTEKLLVMGQMTQALERIAQTYQKTEERAIDNCENPRPAQRYHWRDNDLTKVRKTLSDIKFT